MGKELHRRDALKAIGATIATGSLAGCSGLLSGEMTFTASPATMDVIYGGSDWQDRSAYDSGTPEGARPVVQPISGAELLIRDTASISGIDRDVTVTGYGATHSVEAPVAGPSESRNKSLGEIVVVTAPKTGGFSTYSNSVTDVGIEEVVGAATFGQDARGEPASVDGPVATFEFDGPPGNGTLFQSAYGGHVANMSLDGDPQSVSGGVEASGTVTFARADDGQAREEGPLANVPCTVSGAKVDHGGDVVFLVGWFWDDQDRTIDMGNPPSLLGLGDGAGGSMDFVEHSSDCPDAGCRPGLVRDVRAGRVTVVKRRFQATETAAESMQDVAADLSTTMSDALGLLGDLRANTDDGDTARQNAIDDAGEALDGVGTQLGDVQSDLDSVATIAGNARDTVSPDRLSTVGQTTGDLRVTLNVLGGKNDDLLTSAEDAHVSIEDFLATRSDADAGFDDLQSNLSTVVDLSSDLATQLDVTLTDIEYAHAWVTE